MSRMVTAEEQEAIMLENEMMQADAEVHGYGEKFVTVPLGEIPGCPIPCIRDERGEIKKQTVKALLAKIDEELNELKEAVFRSEEYDNDLNEFSNSIHEFEKRAIAEEAADTITAISTLLEAIGIDAEMRDEAQRRVNAKNREKGRL